MEKILEDRYTTELHLKTPLQWAQFLSLSLNNFPSPYYLTYKQTKDRGGFINKGSKGSLVVFWKMIDVEDANQEKRIPFLRYTYAFNLSQTSLYTEIPAPENTILPCELIADQIRLKVTVKNNISRCYYNPSGDHISSPQIQDFDSPEEYYSSLFHEAVHATGHNSRLDRIGKVSREEEELVAEIGSAYLCGMAGISPKVLDNQSAYIDGWLKIAKENELLIIHSARGAQRAVDYFYTPEVPAQETCL